MEEEKKRDYEIRRIETKLSILNREKEKADTSKLFKNKLYESKTAAYKFYEVDLVEIERLEAKLVKLKKQRETSKGVFEKFSENTKEFLVGLFFTPKRDDSELMESRVKGRGVRDKMRDKYDL